VVVVNPTSRGANALSVDDIRGSHVLLMPSPGTSTPLGYGMVNRLAELDPASVILVVRQSDREWQRSVAASRERILTRTPWRDPRAPPVLTLRAGGLHRLLPAPWLEARGDSPAEHGYGAVQRVPGVSLRISPKVRVVEELSAPNVVGILPGRDPTLRAEYVLYSGHMDHLGVGVPDRYGDSIYNGADDSASGMATIMEVAEAFAALGQAPRRSVIFLAVSGEEKGLLGSRYFARFPPVPVGAIVANLNAGMVGRNSPDTIVAVGKVHSGLGTTLTRVGSEHPELGMAIIDDPWPEQRFFERSDHLPFARMGIPALFFFSGLHEDYHRPSDELPKLDPDKSARVGRLLFFLGLEVGDNPARPAWNPESYAGIVTSARR
jgi:hypothetical protein